MTLLGWTLDQWAIVVNYFPPDELTIDEALRIAQKWIQSYKSSPGGVIFYGCEHPKNIHLAADLFEAIAKEENIFLKERAFS